MNQVKELVKRFFSFKPYLVLFLGSFIFFGFIADYTTYYQEKISLFVFSGDYLTGHLNQPGSLLIWIADLLTTFYYYPVAGAVIVSIIICLTALMSSKVISQISGNESFMMPLFTGLVLFFFHSNYQYLIYNSAGILIQLTIFYLTIRYLKGWFSLLSFPFIYFVTGGFAWIFIIMFSLYLASVSLKNGWLKILLLWITSVVIIFLLKEFILFQSLETLLSYPFSNTGTGFQSKFFIAYSVIIVSLPLTARVKIKYLKKIRMPGIITRFGPSLVVFIILIIVSYIRFDVKTKQYFLVEKLFCQNRFDEVIDYNLKNPSNNMLTIYLDNIALCETGRLNDKLFYFRQHPEGQTLFLKWEMSGEVLRRGGYFYYTIGMINEAQRWAYENMIMKGHTPDDLNMLIKTEIIIGNYETASKYIAVLKKTLFHRKEAKYYETFLFNDEAVESDPRLGPKRREKLQHDFFSITDDPYVNIERILFLDSLNRKALEYKLAYLLLKKDYLGIVSQLKDLGKYGFTGIPVHVDEAAEAYRTLNLGPMPSPGNLRSDPQTATRFSQFLQTFQFYGNNLKTAEPALRQKFGNTFWYWAFYR